jgi:uncharacterized protein with GYD domain
MPLFISQGKYSREAIKGMVYTPENRTEAVHGLYKDAGCNVLNFYVTMGEYDWLVVYEAPNEIAGSAAILAAIAGGGITDTKTCVAMTGSDAMTAYTEAGRVARSFRSAGNAASYFR